MQNTHPLHDPTVRAALVNSTEPFSVAVFVAVLGIVTLASQALPWWSGDPITAGPLVVFAGLTVAALFYRSAVQAGDTRRFDVAMVVVEVLQVMWVAAVSWSMPVSWSLASAGLTGGFLVAWAFLDAQQFRGLPRIRQLYVVGFALVPAYLLVLDAVGQDGLLTRFARSPEDVLQWVFMLALMAGIALAILVVVGQHAREAAERQLES